MHTLFNDTLEQQSLAWLHDHYSRLELDPPTFLGDGKPVGADGQYLQVKQRGKNASKTVYAYTKHNDHALTVSFVTKANGGYRDKATFTLDTDSKASNLPRVESKPITPPKKSPTPIDLEKVQIEFDKFSAHLGNVHPYLTRKQVPAVYGLRFHKDNLIVPAFQSFDHWRADRVTTYQRLLPKKIEIDGDWTDKLFRKGTGSTGTFFPIGLAKDTEPEQIHRIYIGEGYATCVSVHQATDQPAIVAFNAGNLLSAAQKVRARYPNALIIIAGDDDRWKELEGKGNAGRKYAQEVCEAVPGTVAVFPDFDGLDLSTKPTDFNDLFCLLSDLQKSLGLNNQDAVKGEMVKQLTPPAKTEPATAPATTDPVTINQPGPVNVNNKRISPKSKKFKRTEMGNGERFAHQHRDVARFVHKFDQWLTWDKKYWEIDNETRVLNLAKDTVRTIYKEASLAKTEDERTEIATWAIMSEARKHISNMLWFARSEEGMSVTPDQINSDDWLLNLNNGTLDLRTGKLQPHSPNDLITKILPWNYNPNAKCPTWSKFLEEITCGDTNLIKYLQKAVGYSLTGDTREQCFFFLYGKGNNGKSTFCTTALEKLLGSGQYMTRTPAETLMKKHNNGGIPNDKARLNGARVALSAEIADDAVLNEAFIKDVTGQDTITARFLNKEFFDFTPRFKLWMYGNHKPTIRGTDKGIKRRPRLIPFNQNIPDNQKDSSLPTKLNLEMEGILAWAVQGCLLWQREGLESPTAVVSATESYLAEMDVIGLFIADSCVTSASAKTPAKALYAAYVKWATDGNESVMNQRRFLQSMTERGFTRTRHFDGFRWNGIGIIDTGKPVESTESD